MKDTRETEQLRKQIAKKLEAISDLQEEMLKPKKMIGASLIKRYLGTQKKKRSSYAFYLSISKNGKTKLEHVSKNEIEEVKNQVSEWKNYQANLRQWRKLIKNIDQDFKELGRLQNQLKKEK